jgi:hypothetical protein
MNAGRSPHVAHATRQVQRGAGRLDVGADGHQTAHPGRAGAFEHGRQIVSELGKMQVGVGVEEVGCHGTTRKRNRPTS